MTLIAHLSDDQPPHLANLILVCPRHHTLLHDRLIHTSGTGAEPVFTDRTGHAITTNQPHAPPG
jgi:hypothetical protein